MGQRIEHWCDFCQSKIIDIKLLDKIEGVDICKGCQKKILTAVIKSQSLFGKTLPPFCKLCNGKGYIKQHEYHGPHNDYEIVSEDCKQCLTIRNI